MKKRILQKLIFATLFTISCSSQQNVISNVGLLKKLLLGIGFWGSSNSSEKVIKKDMIVPDYIQDIMHRHTDPKHPEYDPKDPCSLYQDSNCAREIITTIQSMIPLYGQNPYHPDKRDQDYFEQTADKCFENPKCKKKFQKILNDQTEAKVLKNLPKCIKDPKCTNHKYFKEADIAVSEQKGKNEYERFSNCLKDPECNSKYKKKILHVIDYDKKKKDL